jgi:FkbM family methyltransferase
MAINRKEWLRYTGAAAAGAAIGAVARGLVAPDAPDADRGGILEPTAGWAIPPAPIGSAPKPPPRAVGNESYSQCGEDLVVAFTMGYLGIGPHITYLDVGANDPVQLNNTYYFYRKGHHGVLVEPNGALCRLLRDRRRGDTVLEAGIGASAGEADYYVMSFDGLNTFSKEEADHRVENSHGEIAIRQVIRMPLLDINDVMAGHFGGAPTFLSVDTEGLDLAILRSIDYGRFRPAIICAETLASGTRNIRTEIPEFLATQGYAARGGSFVNTIFVDAQRI